MSEGSNINRLSEAFADRMKRMIPTQVFWGTVKEVDWNEKTCTVTGLGDSLDFFDVGLGLNGRTIKPVVGTQCMIGAIDNKATDLYLIDAAEIEEYIWINKTAELHVTESGFVFKNSGVDLKEMLDKTYSQLDNAIIQTPAGPGNFSPGDKIVFKQLKQQVKTLFK